MNLVLPESGEPCPGCGSDEGDCFCLRPATGAGAEVQLCPCCGEDRLDCRCCTRCGAGPDSCLC